MERSNYSCYMYPKIDPVGHNFGYDLSLLFTRQMMIDVFAYTIVHKASVMKLNVLDSISLLEKKNCFLS